ncbi:Protein CBG17582 [Caenorhabditis briggsae]|uniref:Protein CBG17582 n=1 Tax=Caenorhabditis briggsae TaxID=6238 RepID=A8XRA1_CAEBR|nr:Protein CBG17582 [Caenorhabditis briggsae]CAP35198.2 Protein CBG17582 [Caenorhabditis briggsae]
MRERDDRKPSVTQNLSEIMLEVSPIFIINSALGSSSTNTLTDLAQRRHGAGAHRRSNASSTVSTHSGGRSTCAMMNTLHMAVAHKQRDIVELLLKNGYDPNTPASCHCKGNCTATGNIPLTSIIPRTHSMTPELCSTCSQLRVVSIVDQTPLGVAVRSQSSELIALLIAYGGDVNLGERSCRISGERSWEKLAYSKNNRRCRGPAYTRSFSLEPKLSKKICEESVHLTLLLSSKNFSRHVLKSFSRTRALEIVNRRLDPHQVHQRKIGIDFKSTMVSVKISQGERSLSKAPLSPKPSAAASVSTCSMLETSSAKESARRKSLVSLQLHRKSRNVKEYFQLPTRPYHYSFLFPPRFLRFQTPISCFEFAHNTLLLYSALCSLAPILNVFPPPLPSFD